MAAPASGSKPLRGIFPIAQSPFTGSDKLDLDCLVEQVRFLDRGKVHAAEKHFTHKVEGTGKIKEGPPAIQE